MYGRRMKLSKPKTQKQCQENLTKSIKNPFILRKRKRRKKQIKH